MAAVWSTQVIGTQRDPLGFMIGVAADPEQPIATRMTAATAVIPFLYPKLSAATVESHVTTTRADGRSLIAELEARICRVPLLESNLASAEAVEPPDASSGASDDAGDAPEATGDAPAAAEAA